MTLVTDLNGVIQDLHLCTCVTFVSRLECIYICIQFLLCGNQVCVSGSGEKCGNFSSVIMLVGKWPLCNTLNVLVQ